MAGAQLLLLRSSAPPKSKKRKWFWSPSRVNDRLGGFIGRGMAFSKIEIEGDLGRDERKQLSVGEDHRSQY